MATTASGLVYPTSADDVDPPDDIKKLADSVEPFVAVPLARLILPAAQSIPNGVDTAVSFGASSELYDTGLHSTTTNPTRLIGTRPGWYRFTGAPSWASSTAGQRVHFFAKNGAARAPSLRWNFGQPAQTIMLPAVTVLIDLNGTTDYVEFMVNQGSGGNLNLNGDGNQASVFNTIVEVEFIRPL